MKNTPDTLLEKTVLSLLDDQHGIPEKSVNLLMELVSAINPSSKALEYLAEASIYKGRAFLPEDYATETENWI